MYLSQFRLVRRWELLVHPGQERLRYSVLVARFYDPTHGRVMLDGEDLRNFRLQDIYTKLAIVTQDPFLFSTSIRENILCGRPDATQEEIEAAAARCRNP